MAELEKRGIPFRNEQQLQDITVEPAARIIVDFLSCLYGQREPETWVRLMGILIPFADDDIKVGSLQNYQRFIKEQRDSATLAEAFDDPYVGWWSSVETFLKKVGLETLIALSHDYESQNRLIEIIGETKSRIEELSRLEPNLPKALKRFSDDQAIRILTIHKSKGLEFDSVVILAIENEIFWGDQDENRCAFFVGVSRAKRRLVLTHVDERTRPPNHHGGGATIGLHNRNI